MGGQTCMLNDSFLSLCNTGTVRYQKGYQKSNKNKPAVLDGGLEEERARDH